LGNTALKHVAKESCAPLYPAMGYAVHSIQFPNLFKLQFASDCLAKIAEARYQQIWKTALKKLELFSEQIRRCDCESWSRASYL